MDAARLPEGVRRAKRWPCTSQAICVTSGTGAAGLVQNLLQEYALASQEGWP
jgi:hypothetical protein